MRPGELKSALKSQKYLQTSQGSRYRKKTMQNIDLMSKNSDIYVNSISLKKDKSSRDKIKKVINIDNSNYV